MSKLVPAMSKLVVDASVAAKWLVSESLSDKALAILDGSNELVAPDLMLAEIGNILWKKARSGDLTAIGAIDRLRALASMGVRFVPSAGLVDRALVLALETGRTVYDSMYLALAEQESCPFVTADERLVNALAHTGSGSHASWLGSR